MINMRQYADLPYRISCEYISTGKLVQILHSRFECLLHVAGGAPAAVGRRQALCVYQKGEKGLVFKERMHLKSK